MVNQWLIIESSRYSPYQMLWMVEGDESVCRGHGDAGRGRVSTNSGASAYTQAKGKLRHLRILRERRYDWTGARRNGARDIFAPGCALRRDNNGVRSPDRPKLSYNQINSGSFLPFLSSRWQRRSAPSAGFRRASPPTNSDDQCHVERSFTVSCVRLVEREV